MKLISLGQPCEQHHKPERSPQDQERKTCKRLVLAGVEEDVFHFAVTLISQSMTNAYCAMFIAK